MESQSQAQLSDWTTTELFQAKMEWTEEAQSGKMALELRPELQLVWGKQVVIRLETGGARVEAQELNWSQIMKVWVSYEIHLDWIP